MKRTEIQVIFGRDLDTLVIEAFQCQPAYIVAITHWLGTHVGFFHSGHGVFVQADIGCIFAVPIVFNRAASVPFHLFECRVQGNLEAEARQVKVVTSFESRVHIDCTVCIDRIGDVEWQYHLFGSASYGRFQARGNGNRLFVGSLFPVECLLFDGGRQIIPFVIVYCSEPIEIETFLVIDHIRSSITQRNHLACLRIESDEESRSAETDLPFFFFHFQRVVESHVDRNYRNLFGQRILLGCHFVSGIRPVAILFQPGRQVKEVFTAGIQSCFIRNRHFDIFVWGCIA